MPITLDGTNGITTPDVESSGPIRASAYLDAAGGNTATINGKLPIALGDVPAPTTAQVGTATANLSAGDVGSYAFLYCFSNVSTGTTVAGSSLQYAGAISAFGSPHRWEDLAVFSTVGDTSGFPTNPPVGASPAGTWRCLGNTSVYTYKYVSSGANRVYSASLYLRVS